MKAIGVFCARVRVEEKQIIAAIGAAGVVAVPVLPASTPLPPGPVSPAATTGGFLGNGTESMPGTLGVLIDRSPNRAVASATLPLVRLNGVRTIDAGIAATGSRVQVATALEEAGLPRPECLVGFSEESAVEAVQRLGHPATLLGLVPGSSSVALLDADTAEAVIEHRVVLGDQGESIVLIQAGAPAVNRRTIVHVVGDEAIAVEGTRTGADDLRLAVRAAAAIGAYLAAVELAVTEKGLVIWDIRPVTDFRAVTLLGDRGVPESIARLAIAMAGESSSNGTPRAATAITSQPLLVEEARHGVALSA